MYTSLFAGAPYLLSSVGCTDFTADMTRVLEVKDEESVEGH